MGDPLVPCTDIAARAMFTILPLEGESLLVVVRTLLSGSPLLSWAASCSLVPCPGSPAIASLPCSYANSLARFSRDKVLLISSFSTTVTTRVSKEFLGTSSMATKTMG